MTITTTVSTYVEVDTDRFTLRPLRLADAPQVYDILRRHEVMRWLDDSPVHLMRDEQEAVAWIERRHREVRDDPHRAVRAIVPHDTGELAGSVMVSRLVRGTGGFVGEYKLDWHLHPDSRGHGYASEAASLLAAQAFVGGVEELTIDMFEDNAAAARVARRIGAHEVGVQPDRWHGGRSLMFCLEPPVVETPRLELRPYTVRDVDAVLTLFQDPQVARWSGDGRPMSDRRAALERILRQPARAGASPATGIFAVRTRADADQSAESGESPVDSHPSAAVPAGSSPIGMGILAPLPRSDGQPATQVEIGWHFEPEVWGHGFATESAAALVARAREAGFPEVLAVTNPANERSQDVCRRLGMTDLGLRGDWYGRTLRAFSLALD